MGQKRFLKILLVLAKAIRNGRPVYDIKNLCHDKSNDAKNEDTLRKVDLKKTKVKYIRGLLGFAGNYEFKDLGEISQRGTRYGSVKFQLKTDSAVKRFPCPVTYLPDERKMCLLVHKSHVEELLKINPSISIEPKNERGIQAEKIHMELPEDFDIKDFFDSLTRNKILCRVRSCLSKDRNVQQYCYLLKKV